MREVASPQGEDGGRDYSSVSSPDKGSLGYSLPLLPLPPGEVAERSEVGEGRRRNALSVSFADSSPKGRAKGLRPERGLFQGESQASAQKRRSTNGCGVCFVFRSGGAGHGASSRSVRSLGRLRYSVGDRPVACLNSRVKELASR